MIESVALVLELLVVLISLSKLFDRKFKINIYMVILILFYLFIFNGINSYSFPMYISILAYIAIFLYGLFYYKKSLMVTLINCLLSFAIISVLQLIFYIPVFYITDLIDSDIKIDEVMLNVASLVSIIVIRDKIKLKLLTNFLQKKSWIIRIIFVAIIFYLFINIFSMKTNLFMDNAEFIQIIFFMVLFFIAINEWQKAIADAERKRTQLEMNKLYYDAYDELILLIRERQHDMKNHINAILGMIYTINDYKELVENQKRYCDDVMKKNRETKLLLSMDNPLMAGFLYRKLQEAQKFGITTDHKVISKENAYYFPEYDLIEMVGILLDNAIEALREKAEMERKIYVEISNSEHKLCITVANVSRYFEPDEICKFFQKDFTSKGKGHGIGLTKLKRMVKERGGDIAVTNESIEEKNYLQFCIILPKKKQAIR